MDSISGLTLLEVSELVTALKVSIGRCGVVCARRVGKEGTEQVVLPFAREEW